MTLTISVRLRAAPRAGQPGMAQPATAPRPARRSSPPISIRHGSPAPASTLAPAAVAHEQHLPSGTGAAGRGTGPLGAEALGSLLALAEPAALLLAEAAGFGLLGKVVLATAMRTAQRALA